MNQENGPRYITEKILSRVAEFGIGQTFELNLEHPEKGSLEAWWSQFGYGTKFTFPFSKSEGIRLWYELQGAVLQQNEAVVWQLLQKIEKHKVPSYMEKSEAEKWAHMVRQMPEDWGPAGRDRKRLKTYVSRKAEGKILEAMCGFESYFDSRFDPKSVTALDFCEDALLRYSHPERTRILYDLENLNRGKMNFFEDWNFQTIGIFFGVNYLTNPTVVYKEFYRLLSENGKILIVNSPNCGYEDLVKRRFDHLDTTEELKSTGFKTRFEKLTHISKPGSGPYYLIEATKTSKLSTV